MNRRGFLGSILALAAAPAIVRADSLMRCVPIDTTVIGVDLARGRDIAMVGRIDRFTIYESKDLSSIHEIWTKELNRKWYEAKVFGEIAQRDYEAAMRMLDAGAVPVDRRAMFIHPSMFKVLR